MTALLDAHRDTLGDVCLFSVVVYAPISGPWQRLPATVRDRLLAHSLVLQEAVGKAGASMNEASRNAILSPIDHNSSDQSGTFSLQYPSCSSARLMLHGNFSFCEDAIAITNARLLGVPVKVLPPTTAIPLIKYEGPLPGSLKSLANVAVTEVVLSRLISRTRQCPDLMCCWFNRQPL